VEIVLAWRALDVTSVRYKVFLHVTDASGRIVAQADRFPLDGAMHTDWWVPGQWVEDRFTLDLTGLAPGDYRMIGGMYDPGSGARLPTSRPDGALDLGTLHLR
jgi:hypothetical protein